MRIGSIKFISILFFLLTLLFLSRPSYSCELTFKATEDGFYDGNVLTNSRRLDITNTTSTDKLALLKFDVTQLKNSKDTKVVSVKLKLYVDTSYMNPKINAYYESHDNWSEGNYLESHSIKFSKTYKPTGKYATGSDIQVNNSNDTKWIEWDLTALNIPKFKNKDNILTIALADVSKDSLNSSIRFFSKEYCCVYAPQIIVETTPNTPTPNTPEPSSLILSLMSIGGVFGFKRKSK